MNEVEARRSEAERLEQANRDPSGIYCVVSQLSTGRKFALDRRYDLIGSATSVDIWQALGSGTLEVEAGWLPTFKSQRPEWAHDASEADFEATWTRLTEVARR